MLGGEQLSSHQPRPRAGNARLRRRGQARAHPQGRPVSPRAESDPNGVGPSLSEGGERSGEGAACRTLRRRSRPRRGQRHAEPQREIVLVTGISGSGKSVALHALEDAGFFCVDNLPPELLREFLRLETQRRDRRVAIAVDVRSAGSLPHLLPLLAQLRGEGIGVQAIFLDASTDALVRRFSETRRRTAVHGPLGADARRALIEAIELERQLLADLREVSTVIDTSQLRPAQLRAWMRELVGAADSRLTLVFESFAFKHGVPLDADYVFDIRVLPNPHYVRELRPLTGRDAAVAAYLRGAARGARDADADRGLPAPLAAGVRGRPAQLPDGGDRLHRRPAPLGLVRRAAGAIASAAAAPALVRHRELDAAS